MPLEAALTEVEKEEEQCYQLVKISFLQYEQLAIKFQIIFLLFILFSLKLVDLVTKATEFVRGPEDLIQMSSVIELLTPDSPSFQFPVMWSFFECLSTSNILIPL